MKLFVGGIVLLLVVFFVVSTTGSQQNGGDGVRFDAGVNRVVWGECVRKRDDMRQYVLRAQDLEILKYEGSWFAIEAAWRELSHNQKVNLAVAIYCGKADEVGRGSARINGYRTGKALATVVDGHYSD